MGHAIVGSALLLISCGGGGASDPCADVDCSSVGRCVSSGASAACDCDPGWVAQGLTCVPEGGDSDSDSDSDSDVDTDVDTDSDSDSDSDTEACVIPDVDEDGYDSIACGGDDCNDDDRDVHPDTADTAGNALDENCDGVDGVDADGDGWAGEASGGRDCDDGDRDVRPDAVEDEEWNRQLVDDAGWLGSDIDVGARADGHGHVSYYDAGALALRYATNEGGAWAIETLDDDGGASSSIAVDEDAVHITFSGLDYATNASGAWVVETPDPIWSLYTSLVVDPDGALHASYFAPGEGDLHYLTNASGDWVSERVDSAGVTGRDPSTVIDGDGDVHIVYYDETDQQIRHAEKVGGAWSIETVITLASPLPNFEGGCVDAAGDGGDVLHVTYLSELHDLVYYSQNSDAGRWTVPFPISYGATHTAAVAVAPDGLVHFAGEGQAANVYHGTLEGTAEFGLWIWEDVDTDERGGDVSLAIDPTGGVHVAYQRRNAFGFEDDELWYAHLSAIDAIDNDCDGAVW